MTKAYIIAETKDEEILKAVLPQKILQNTEVVTTPYNSSLASLGRSARSVKRLPVAVVANTNSHDECLIQEEMDLLEWDLRSGPPDIPYQVFLAIPEIEGIFLHDRQFVERLAQHEFSELEWELGKHSPKKLLQLALGKTYPIPAGILRKLDRKALAAIRKHPLVDNLCQFLVANLH